MRKYFIGIVLTLVSITAAFATTPYEEIMRESKANSPQMSNAELTYLNSKLSQAQKDQDGNVSIEVGTGTVSVLPSDVTKDMYANPYATVILPNDGATTFKISSPLGFNYEEETAFAISPELSVAHRFDLNKGENKISDLSDVISNLTTEMSYQSSVISFENTVITSISSILSAEKQVATTKRSIEKAEESLNNQLTLGKISKDSLAYKKSSIDLERSKQSLEAMEKQIQNAIDNFKVLTGIEWEGIDSIPTPNLTFEPLNNGNTNVYLKQLNVEIAAENLTDAVKTNNSQSISVGAGVKGANLLTDVDKYSLNGSVSYALNTTTKTKDTVKVNAAFGADYSITDDKLTPTLTMSASWKNNSAVEKSISDIQVLQNKLQQAQNEYQNAYTSYTQSVQNMHIEIFNYEYKVSANDINDEYLQSTLDYQNELFEAGLSAESAVKDAEFNVKMAEYDRMTIILEGLKLENSIKQLLL